MIIYEKIQLIQGKTVETLFFFFQLRIHKVQYVLYPTRGGLETHSISVSLCVPFDIRVVRFVKLLINVRGPCEGTNITPQP
jgi:hypothetical protein